MTAIIAEFDGAPRTFEITPENTPIFEACLPEGSAYALLKVFSAGLWTAGDVATVLSFALHGPSPATRQAWAMDRQMAKFGRAPGRVRLTFNPNSDVVDAVSRDGPGNLADLAVEILSNVIFRGKQKESSDE